MSTPTTGRGTRNNRAQTGSIAKQSINLQDLASLSGVMDLSAFTYGGGGVLYDLLANAGTIMPVNNMDNVISGDFFEIRDKLKVGQAAIIEGRFDNNQVAIKTSDKEVMFAGLLHDADGNPQVETDLVLCAVITNRQFQYKDEDGNVQFTIEKGTKFLKALPAEYVAKLKKAA